MNNPPLPPTSPEVISSLISSLSSISTPAQTHFESMPHIGTQTAPPSPTRTPSNSHGRSSEHGFGMDYGAYKTPAESTDPYLHPDDAAISPVVRMAPAPVPSSPRSPRHKFSFGRDQSRPSSRSSHTSSRVAHDDNASSTMGMISAEPGIRPSRTASIASSNSGRRSLKGQLSSLKRGSRELVSDKDKKPSSADDGSKLTMPRSGASLRSRQSMADLVEEGAQSDHTRDVHNEEDRGAPVGIAGPSTASPGGIGSGRIIPQRDSSLRHSTASTSSKKRRSAHSTTRHSSHRDSRAEAESKDTEETNRRIQEVKEQQQRIKTEMQKGPASAPSQKVRSSSTDRRSATDPHSKQRSRDSAPGKENRDPRLGEPFDESAPSPAVQTRRPREIRDKKRQSFEKLDHHPTSPSGNKHHRRTVSGQVSPVRPSIAEERPSSADSIDLAVEAYVSDPRLTQKVPHPRTGRMIAFSEVGDPKGYVVFCCLGMGLTRYLMAFYDELARTLKLRLITLDRPGVGESDPYEDGMGTPLSWPDDIAIVCNHLKITRFSILAHSAGAIYALATALRIPQHIRGRIHLLAPWIPPSQMSGMGTHKEPLPNNAVPYSQRILRALPVPFLKVANSSFMSATSTSLTTSLPKSPRRAKRKSISREFPTKLLADSHQTDAAQGQDQPNGDHTSSNPSDPNSNTNLTTNDAAAAAAAAAAARERQQEYDTRLTYRIWELATTNANPAVDLLVCLERRQTIGFRYVDINREVVIHHGSRDTRVPVDNVRWLGKTMRRCEVRVLEGEGHGLMASAIVMSNVLSEIAKEWEDWTTLVQGRRGVRRATISHHASRTGIMV
ncbi:hypothetical protein VTN31DRAFT_4026 [Thermomyces dupontii]|uniref:uncharacterized protein n=1 Tax=Talaromyces thermophilus TaxID=28565 RepID=UPI0037441CAB